MRTPKSFSASALLVAEQCLARYAAENLEYGRGIQNNAAMTGTSVHWALEEFVEKTVRSQQAEYSLKTLLAFFDLGFMQTFGTSDLSGPEYEDGKQILTGWFPRQDFTGVTVLSCEVKQSFPIPTSKGDIPFNYIIDRFDQLGDNEYQVVDYKSNRMNINHDDLRDKLQARCYSLATRIKYPDAERIWVVFDMLRYDSVGVSFTRDDDIKTWHFLKRLTSRIVDWPENERVPETLNEGCGWCVRKSTCETLLKNVNVGGVFSLTMGEKIKTRAELDFQRRGVMNAIDELDKILLAEAKKEDLLDFDTPDYTMAVGMASRRSIDPERARKVLGEELFNQYGSQTLTVTAVDDIIKDASVPDKTKKALKALVFMKPGKESIKIKPKGAVK